VLGIEAYDCNPIVLNTRNRRLKPIALKSGRFCLGGCNTLFPASIRVFLTRYEMGGNDDGSGRRKNSRSAVLDDVDVVATGQNGLDAFD
jgi:hypothetical protein